MKTKILLIIALLIALVEGARGQIYVDSYRFGVVANRLLDDYPDASGAYSLRLLDKDYSGNCLRIRKTGGDTTDIGFVNNYLDTATLKTFCGSGATDTCRIVQWYDQSGNNLHLRQNDNSLRPWIAIAGNLTKSGGETAIRFTANIFLQSNLSDLFTFPSAMYVTYVLSFSEYSSYIYAIQTVSSGNGNNGWWNEYGKGRGFTFYNNGNNRLDDNLIAITNLSTNTQYLNVFTYNGSTLEGFYNNSKFGSNAVNVTLGTNNRPLILGGAYTSGLNGFFQEIIIWPIDRSLQRTEIQNNINNFYGIY